MHELRREEGQLDDLLEVLEQSRDGILTNRDHLYVSYGDIGQTGVADNNKILAVQHPLDTNITKDVTWVSLSNTAPYPTIRELAIYDLVEWSLQ